MRKIRYLVKHEMHASIIFLPKGLDPGHSGGIPNDDTIEPIYGALTGVEFLSYTTRYGQGRSLLYLLLPILFFSDISQSRLKTPRNSPFQNINENGN